MLTSVLRAGQRIVRPMAMRSAKQGTNNQSTNVNNVQKRYKALFDVGLPPLDYGALVVGQEGTQAFKVYLTDKDGNRLSYWHDIPLYAGTSPNGTVLLNYVNEIPRATRAKMEVSKEEELNPIKQDIKKGELRFIKWSPVLFNYGSLPQTYEDPEVSHPETGKPGDADPLDVIDIGYARVERGEVVRVKILGALAFIDEGETDWKIIAINLNDPRANAIRSVADVEKYKPGVLHSIREFYTNYKVPDGKPKNEFAFDGAVKDAAYALKVVEEAHQSWKKLTSAPSHPKYSFKRGTPSK